MPVRPDEFRRRELHPIFQMNLPEGYVLEQLRNRLAKTVNVDPMLLLALSGSSSPIGRVRVRSEAVDALLGEQQFPGEKLEEILTWDGTEDIFAELLDRYILQSYAAIAKAIRLFCPAQHLRSSLDQLFDSVALSCIVGNGDAHLKNFGLLYSHPTQRDARLAPAYDIVNTTAYIPEDVLALDLAGNKSMFASQQGLLEFAQNCEIEKPRERIQTMLAAVEVVIARYPQYREQASHVVGAIEQAAAPIALTFG
jgi:serine/threonine protein kinase HipA of HipAB toxin-antitoxin module